MTINHLIRPVAALVMIAGLAGCVTGPLPPQVTAYSADRPAFVRSNPPKTCVPFARENSTIAIYGDAYTWWNKAEGHYPRDSRPRSGAIMVLHGYAGPKRGHLAVVRRIVSDREIRVDHANWLSDGNIHLNSPVIDVSPGNDWSQVRVWNNRDGHLGGRTYHVRGFIAPMRIASL